MIKTADLFDLSHTLAKDFLSDFEYPWQALSGISEMIKSLTETLEKSEYNQLSEYIWIHKTAVISPSAYIGSPCIIGAESEIRHCAFIRGSALIGKKCVVGNSAELKNVILFDNVQTPHYNYVGDSILGYKAHMGAGSITSNVKSDKSFITIKSGYKNEETKLKKCGAFLGDFVEIGCNSVLNPGTIIGKNTNIYPLSNVRGFVESNCILKSNGIIVKKY